MKPQFSEAAKRLVDEGAGKLGALDSTTNELVTGKFKIQGFPTLKYFENGKFNSDYNGKRTADELFKFVKESGNKVTKDEL